MTTIPESVWWQNRDYLRLLSAQIISLVGTGMSSICLALLAYDLAEQDASMVLSIAFALKMLAYIGVAPLFGSIAHRLPKRITLVALDLVRALVFVCLPFVTQVWEVYLLMFVVNACSAGFTPLFQSTIPAVLPDKKQYVRALSMSRIAYDIEQIVSPMLVAVLLSLVSYRELFLLDAATFILSGLLILLCTIPTLQLTQPNTSSTPINVMANLKAYLKKPKLRALWFAYLSAASASAMVLVNTVVYVHNILHGGERQTAVAMMVVGLGSMLIAFGLPRLIKRYPVERFHWFGLITIGCAFWFGALTPGWLGFILVCLALGVGMSCIQTTSGLIITEESAEQETATYFSAHFSLTLFWWLFTYLAAGFSAKYWGVSVSYMVMGCVCILSSMAYWRATKCE